ncbi:MAG: hypothetical protein RMJ88_05870 [Thermogemmata sp.]|nr:hypothetical protein [Thermogemmata sp.]
MAITSGQRVRRRWTAGLTTLAAGLLLGPIGWSTLPSCSQPSPSVFTVHPAQPAAVESTSKASSAPTGTAVVSGQVFWSANLPPMPDCMAWEVTVAGELHFHSIPHPNRLVLTLPHGGLAETFVWLQPLGMSTASAPTATRSITSDNLPLAASSHVSAPAHPPVCLHLSTRAVQVEQNGQRRRLGIISPGTSITIHAEDEAYHVVAGRGAAFFRWTVPVGCSPLYRLVVPRPAHSSHPHAFAASLGADDPRTPYPIVELFDDAGRYWTRAYLLMCNHPYAAVTDAAGRFRWAEVPAGEWELIVWQPSWIVRRQERDPETTRVVRQFFTAPLVLRRSIHVEAGQNLELRLDLSAARPP